MKNFEIRQWSYSVEYPNNTNVSVEVKEEVAPGIEKKVTYDLVLNKRFETMSDEFRAEIREVLRSAQLL